MKKSISSLCLLGALCGNSSSSRLRSFFSSRQPLPTIHQQLLSSSSSRLRSPASGLLFMLVSAKSDRIPSAQIKLLTPQHLAPPLRASAGFFRYWGRMAARRARYRCASHLRQPVKNTAPPHFPRQNGHWVSARQTAKITPVNCSPEGPPVSHEDCDERAPFRPSPLP